MPVPSAISDLSTTPASNSPAGSETPSSTDDYLRTQASFIKQIADESHIWCGTATGTANAIVLTPSVAITSYVAGKTFSFKAASDNSGATTVAVSGLAAIAVQVNGAACIGGEIAAGKWYEVLVDSTLTSAQISKIGKATAAEISASSLLKVSSSVASATTVDLTGQKEKTVFLTGTTPVTAWTMTAGQTTDVVSTAATPLTYNVTTNKVTGGVSRTTIAGDAFRLYFDGTTVHYLDYARIDGLAVLPASNSVYSSYTTNADLPTTIPFDDSTPQINEGTQILEATITPRFSTSKIRLRFQGDFSVTSGVQGAVAALFDGSASAIRSRFLVPASTGQVIALLEHEYVPGVTTAITYTLRVGAQTNSIRLNGSASGRLGSGSQAATLIAEEILV